MCFIVPTTCTSYDNSNNSSEDQTNSQANSDSLHLRFVKWLTTLRYITKLSYHLLRIGGIESGQMWHTTATLKLVGTAVLVCDHWEHIQFQTLFLCVWPHGKTGPHQWVGIEFEVPTRVEKQVLAHTHQSETLSALLFSQSKLKSCRYPLGETRWKAGIRVRKSVESFCECSFIEYKVFLFLNKKNK